MTGSDATPQGVSRPVCMGIVNLTPDSFSEDGLLSSSHDEVVVRAAAVCGEGAGIVDVGAMSTRPGHGDVTPAEELGRLAPHLAEIVRIAGDVTVSVDTYRPSVAAFAISCGVRLVNSVWGVYTPDGQVDVDMLAVVRDSDCSFVLMHNSTVGDARSGGLGGYFDTTTGGDGPDIGEVVRGRLLRQVEIATDFGISADRLIVDPGIGFGVSPTESLGLLRALPDLVAIGTPVLISASRKSVVGFGTGAPTRDHRRRDAGTHAVTAYATTAGVAVVRAHDVAGNVSAIDMTLSLLHGRFAPGAP